MYMSSVRSFWEISTHMKCICSHWWPSGTHRTSIITALALPWLFSSYSRNSHWDPSIIRSSPFTMAVLGMFIFNGCYSADCVDTWVIPVSVIAYDCSSWHPYSSHSSSLPSLNCCCWHLKCWGEVSPPLRTASQTSKVQMFSFFCIKMSLWIFNIIIKAREACFSPVMAQQHKVSFMLTKLCQFRMSAFSFLVHCRLSLFLT